jgi:hypothetical protein
MPAVGTCRTARFDKPLPPLSCPPRWRALGGLSPELLDPILQVECVYGGRTVSALRLLDRATHAAAEHYRFRNLVHELERAKGAYQPMQHLIVSDTRRSVAEGRRNARHSATAAKRFGVLLYVLLQLAGAHLRTLTVLLYNSQHVGTVPFVLSRAALPTLETIVLQIAGTFPIPQRQQSRPTAFRLPALRRVTLGLPRHTHPGRQYRDEFAACPHAVESFHGITDHLTFAAWRERSMKAVKAIRQHV